MSLFATLHEPARALGLAWERPLGLAALALPVLVLLLHRARARPEPTATGTLALWREAGGARSTRDARARRALPPRTWILLAALCTGAIALAGPRFERPPLERTWRVVVDRSPSMLLEWRDADGAGDGRTRLARALELLEPFLEERAQRGERVSWVTYGPEGALERDGARPPVEWLAAPESAWPEPPWGALDADGALWLTDRAPDAQRARAGLCASGGAAVPGLVGRDRAGLVAWDGELLVAAREEGERATLAVRGAELLPQELADLLAIWADDRGLARGSEGVDAAELVVAPTGGALVPDELRAGRDGWSLRARAVDGGAPLQDEHGPLTIWLAAEDGRALVTVGEGRVHVALRSIEELEGDPIALALSWAELFDGARRPPPGAVSVAERSAAGAPRFEPPSAPPVPEGTDEPPFALAAWIAVAAFLLALLAVAT